MIIEEGKMEEMLPYSVLFDISESYLWSETTPQRPKDWRFGKVASADEKFQKIKSLKGLKVLSNIKYENIWRRDSSSARLRSRDDSFPWLTVWLLNQINFLWNE